MSIKDGGAEEKRQRAEAAQLKASDGQDYAVNEMGEGDRVLGLTTEYSGWDVYNNEARKVDRELVKDWTASLNFLLLFAAIFAAVLTAFIIESKQMLELDPNTVVVDVLIFYTNNLANGTHTPYTPPEFNPTSSAIAINCLFYASLSASLVAALASVVALQWVADYDAAITRGGSSPEDRAKRRQFRYAGVVSWRMSEIIAALPLLLYFSVVLFFGGLILWMWSINYIVGLVIAGGAGVAILFYGISTFLAVVTVSAPFRTPLSRWIYSLSRLPFSVMYLFAVGMKIRNIPAWFEKQHLLYTSSHKRMEHAVENRGYFGRDALIWLANQLSISQDSYRRLLLLASELPSLNSDCMPSFDRVEAPWDLIFDLLGWKYLTANQGDGVTPEERYGMAILKRCYTIPAVKQLVAPAERLKYATDEKEPVYWSQFCEIAKGGPWNSNSQAPNCLFLLLRDTPDPMDFSPPEMEAIVRAARWRNSELKRPRGWDEVFASSKVFSPTFFNSCVNVFNDIHRLRDWSAWDDEDMKLYTRTASRAVQVATIRGDLTDEATTLLMKAYYGESAWQGADKDQQSSVPETILLLLARQLSYCPATEKVVRMKEFIAMLWLRPSNLVSRNWDSIGDAYGRIDQWNTKITMEWIGQADYIPHIYEIMRTLVSVQSSYPEVGPLWRATAQGEENDPHFVEALSTFDRLMGPDCSSWDHRAMVDLVCQDLELEQAPEVDDDYFTESRVYSLLQLTDPCLQALVSCVRDTVSTRPMFVSQEYMDRWPGSLGRVAEYFYKKSQTTASLHLQATFWRLFPRQYDLYRDALQSPDIFSHLYRIFRYPITCSACCDGPGHLLFHLFSVLSWRSYPKDYTLYDAVPLQYRGMDFSLIVFCMLSTTDPFQWEELLDKPDKQCLSMLKGVLADVTRSRHHFLVWVWNVSRSFEERGVYAEDLAAMLIGAQTAMKLLPEPTSSFVLAPLSRLILRLRDSMISYQARTPAEREAVSAQALHTSQLLLSSLASQQVFGRSNNQLLSCARSNTVGLSPAVGWLSPYTIE